MGKVKDTSNDINPSISLKSTLTKNGSKDNYFNKMLHLGMVLLLLLFIFLFSLFIFVFGALEF